MLLKREWYEPYALVCHNSSDIFIALLQPLAIETISKIIEPISYPYFKLCKLHILIYLAQIYSWDKLFSSKIYFERTTSILENYDSDVNLTYLQLILLYLY